MDNALSTHVLAAVDYLEARHAMVTIRQVQELCGLPLASVHREIQSLRGTVLTCDAHEGRHLRLDEATLEAGIREGDDDWSPRLVYVRRR